MSLGLDESNQRRSEADASHRALRIIWLAIMMGLVVLFVVTRLVQPPAEGGLRSLFWILFAMGLSTFGASFILKSRLLKQAAESRKPELARSAYILAFALCEACGLLGLVAHFVTGVEQYYFFFVLGGFGILIQKPQRDDFLAAHGVDRFADSSGKA